MIDTIAVGEKPNGVAMSTDGSRLYVANSGEDTVSQSDMRTQSVVSNIPIGKKICAFRDRCVARWANGLRDAGKSTNGGGNLCEYENREDFNYLARRAHGFAVSPDGQSLFVSNDDYDSVTRVTNH